MVYRSMRVGLISTVMRRQRQSFNVFPLPNAAATRAQLGATPRDAQDVEQFWLRVLTTNLHANDQIERMEQITERHGQ